MTGQAGAIGRVGVLAAALGVGSILAWVPTAWADRGDEDSSASVAKRMTSAAARW